jgi:hypothetical protein
MLETDLKCIFCLGCKILDNLIASVSRIVLTIRRMNITEYLQNKTFQRNNASADK